MALPWHQLYGSGGDFGVRGWNDPVGVLAAALALVAGFAAWATACAVTPPGRRWAISGRFLAILLGLATLASTALGFFYLPVKARFLVAYDVELRFTSLSSLGSYLRGSACPAPGPGLYLAIAGAVLLVVGALRLRADRAAIDAPD